MIPFDALSHVERPGALYAGVDPRLDPVTDHHPRALGLHPERVDGDLERTLKLLEERLVSEGCAALGECGLDHRDGMPDRDLQRLAFERQLDLAQRLGLPVVVHLVRAVGPALELLEARAPVRGLVHGFSGPAEIVPRLVAAGLHLSFGGLLLNPRARRCREAAARAPEDRLLVETDAPELAPARLAVVVAELARLRGAEPAALAARLDENARALLIDPISAANPPGS